MSTNWHDWHTELNQATAAYNALLKRLAGQQGAAISINVKRQSAESASGIKYDVLDWYCYSAPRASCADCHQPNNDPIHGKPNHGQRY